MPSLRRIEWAAAMIGVALTLGCGLLRSWNMAIGAGFGALFASTNFRLLIWSWSSYIGQQTENPATEANQSLSTMPRFLIKYAVLLAGIFLLIGGLRLHLAGFLVGLGNVILAAGLSPLLLRHNSTAKAKTQDSLSKE